MTDTAAIIAAGEACAAQVDKMPRTQLIRGVNGMDKMQLRITGKNSDGEYWLHLVGGGQNAGFNLGDPATMVGAALLKAASGQRFVSADPLRDAADPVRDAALYDPDGHWGDFLKAACAEAEKAMKKFPQPNYVISKIAEEAGEVVKAALHCAEGRETIENVRGEMKQLIAMLYRLWIEGDEVHGCLPVSAAIAKAEGAGE